MFNENITFCKEIGQNKDFFAGRGDVDFWSLFDITCAAGKGDKIFLFFWDFVVRYVQFW